MKLHPRTFGNVFASYTGPDCGLDFVHKLESPQNHTKPKGLPAGCTKWTVKNRKAYGISMSLYDQHPINGKISGDPIADAFGLCARKNGSIMIVADGVNWGEKSKIAARCAVYGAMKYINEQIFGVKVNSDLDESGRGENNENEIINDVTEQWDGDNVRMKASFENTKDVFDLLLKSLEEAHQMIIKHQGGLTTLCVCFVCPIQQPTLQRIQPSHLLPASQSPLTPPSPKILASPESSSSPSPNSEDEKLLPDLIATSLSGLSSPSSSLPQIPSPSLSSPPSLATNLPLQMLATTPPASAPKKFMACVVNVGDSLAFVFSRRHGVREVTTGSHDVTCERDIRDAGGALGPVSVDGQPELNNLTCSMTCVEAGDVVFLATDGITDNFDPVVTKIAVAKKSSTTQSPTDLMMTKSTTDANDVTNVDDENDDDKTLKEPTTLQPADHDSSTTQRAENLSKPTNFTNIQNSLIEDVEMVEPKLGLEDGKPIMLPFERHRYAIKEMERVLHEFELFTECPCSAQELCGALLQHVLKLTDAKRKVLENPDLYGKKKKLKPEEKQNRDFQITCKLAQSPGKLDHATVIGYEVGCFRGDEDEDYCYDAQ
ncbi:hypothetical protein HELRODRAFT_195063 [Helobdella robusta]|uniref:PPM-type phosphatase domain-containing protein n=1 Tax=Helobdella robusta TaxID=6412 RepID=T1FWQ1_HELRO|nr:hypothetical protein HELRODRAFT_195063 [Helobdella robusta]ESO08685.1 hypothetical protein HELRODRAFT_195063 [Helobdella robusta]